MFRATLALALIIIETPILAADKASEYQSLNLWESYLSEKVETEPRDIALAACHSQEVDYVIALHASSLQRTSGPSFEKYYRDALAAIFKKANEESDLHRLIYSVQHKD